MLIAKLIPGCGNLSDILESSHKAVPFGVFELWLLEFCSRESRERPYRPLQIVRLNNVVEQLHPPRDHVKRFLKENLTRQATDAR